LTKLADLLDRRRQSKQCDFRPVADPKLPIAAVLNEDVTRLVVGGCRAGLRWMYERPKMSNIT
jgi:hypothetical protein